MKFALIFLCLLPFAALQSDEEWLSFKLKYGKAYRSFEDETLRKTIWQENWRKINEHNKEFAIGKHSFTLGENKFADMTFDEFSRKFLGLKAPAQPPEQTNLHVTTRSRLSDRVDLRETMYISPVRDQQTCGSCWTFAAVASIEGAWNTATGEVVNLSEQHLLDCVKDGVSGCLGGLMNPAYEYIQKNGGINTLASYPYENKEGKCRARPENSAAFIDQKSAFKTIPLRDHNAMRDAIENGIPVSVGVLADEKFQLYKSGLYDGQYNAFSALFDPNKRLNHAITIVGFDFTTKDGYYIAKNSWSESWGSDGYILLRGSKNGNYYESAGMLQLASYPLVQPRK